MKFNKISLGIILFLTNATTIFAQPELSPNEVPAQITTNDGKVIEGIIKGSPDRLKTDPWYLQKEIDFISMEKYKTLTGRQLRGKDFETYKGADLKGFKINDTLVFESVDYADMSAVSVGMGRQSYFLRKLEGGKISLYKFHQHPPAVGAYSEYEYKKMMDKCVNQPDYIVFKTGDKKPKNVTDVDLETYINDSPTVLAKYKAGEYGNPKKSETDGGMKKLIKKSMEQSLSLGYVQKIVADYNQSIK